MIRSLLILCVPLLLVAAGSLALDEPIVDPFGARDRSSSPRRHIACDQGLADNVAEQDERVRVEATPKSARAGVLILEGQCVDDEDEPFAGVRLRLTVDTDGEVAWELPPDSTSDVDGRFSFRVPVADEDSTLRVRVLPPHATDENPEVCISEFDLSLTEDHRVNLWEVHVERGFPLRGTVANHLGRPVSGERIDIGNGASVVEQGRFDCGHVVAGDYRPTLTHCSVIEPTQLRVGPAEATTDVRIVVHEPPTIGGQVIDARTDAPIANYPFSVGFSAGEPADSRSDDRGKFLVHAPSMRDTHARFEAAPYVERDHPGLLEVPDEWSPLPARGVVLRVRPWPEFLVRAVFEDGTPASDVRLFAMGTQNEVDRVGESAGVARFKGLIPGQIEVLAKTQSPRSGMSDWCAVDPVEWQRTPFTVVLRKSKPLVVRATLPDEIHGSMWAGLYDRDIRIGRSDVDEHGIATLHAPDRLGGLELFAQGFRIGHDRVTLDHRHERRRVVEVDLRRGESATDDSGSLDVDLTDQADHLLEVYEKYLSLRDVRTRESIRLDLFGGARLSAGTYEILTHPTIHTWTPERGSFLLNQPRRVVASFEIESNEVKNLTLHLPELASGYLAGTLRHGGQPLSDSPVHFLSADGRWQFFTRTDARGRFASTAMIAGTYVACAQGQVDPGVTSRRLSGSQESFRWWQVRPPVFISRPRGARSDCTWSTPTDARHPTRCWTSASTA